VRRALLSAFALSALATAAAVPAVPAAGTHVYSVNLTISVDPAAHRIEGMVSSDAPSEFCELSTVRVRRSMPGKDKVVARLRPGAGKWGMRVRPPLRGKRVYAEILRYHLPSRPVECLGTRSRTVTAR
jgi:hypothetical protein